MNPSDLKTSDAELFVWPDLPELTAENARFEAQLLNAVTEKQLDVAGHQVTLAGPLLRGGRSEHSADIELAGDHLRVDVPEALLNRLFQLHNIQDDWQSYSDDTLALVVEHLVSEVVAPLETTVGGPFRIRAINSTSQASKDAALHFELKIGDDPAIGLSVSAESEVLIRLQTWFAHQQAERPNSKGNFEDLLFQVSLMGPSFQVSEDDFCELRPGDGLSLNCDWDALVATSVEVCGREYLKVRTSQPVPHLQGFGKE